MRHAKGIHGCCLRYQEDMDLCITVTADHNMNLLVSSTSGSAPLSCLETLGSGRLAAANSARAARPIDLNEAMLGVMRGVRITHEAEVEVGTIDTRESGSNYQAVLEF